MWDNKYKYIYFYVVLKNSQDLDYRYERKQNQYKLAHVVLKIKMKSLLFSFDICKWQTKT